MSRHHPSDIYYRGAFVPCLFRKGGEVYKVVTFTDEPTVRIENVRTGEQHSHVISSPLFGTFERYVPAEGS